MRTIVKFWDLWIIPALISGIAEENFSTKKKRKEKKKKRERKT